MTSKLYLLLVLGFVIIFNTTSVSQSSYERKINTGSEIGQLGKMLPYDFQSHSNYLNTKTTTIAQLIAKFKKQNPKFINKSKLHPKFITPVKQKDGLSDPGF